MVRLAISQSIRALDSDERVVGSRVINRDAFLDIMVPFVTHAIPIPTATTEFDTGDGDFLIVLPSDVLSFVSSGVGRRSRNEEDYVVRTHLGRVGLYLKREFALAPESCSVSVLTAADYLAEWEECEQTPLSAAELQGVTHVVVGIQVYAGPASLVQRPRDFVHQLAHMVGEPGRKKVTEALNEAWNIDNYWRTFSEVSD